MKPSRTSAPNIAGDPPTQSTQAVHPLARGWLSTGGTAAPTFDELCPSQIRSALAERPHSALAIELAHHAPAVLMGAMTQARSSPASLLAAAKTAGAYRPLRDAIVLCQITTSKGAASYGMFCAVDTDQISGHRDDGKSVVRNEDVRQDTVAAIAALTNAIGHQLSPVLLIHTPHHSTETGPECAAVQDGADDGLKLDEALRQACQRAGAPAVTETDRYGNTHQLWPLQAGALQDQLCNLANCGWLIVADGNHRTLAARLANSQQFLAMVTTATSTTLGPYHRLVTELPAAAQLSERLHQVGAHHRQLLPHEPLVPLTAGTVHLHTNGRWTAATLLHTSSTRLIDRLDHTLVNAQLLGSGFQLTVDDPRITYLGGPDALPTITQRVARDPHCLAIFIAPLPFSDFVQVNLSRQQLPRKSTWFTPKPLTGLVLAEPVNGLHPVPTVPARQAF